ncbi:MAG: L,D-transpeptidase [Gammaproteobacteria bacterium]|nr:L,D-transpeptidase [Gammaproteobacteria bacterium]
MRTTVARQSGFLFLMIATCLLAGCATTGSVGANDFSQSDRSSQLPLFQGQPPYSSSFNESGSYHMLPQVLNTGGKKTILVDPSAFSWGAYDEEGNLVRVGIATAGADYCPDEGKPCRTHPGKFRIYSLGDASCVSKTYPIGEGGALMPYCMFFNGGQSLHGVPDQMLSKQHLSHGCVRLRIPDAEWLRYSFADMNTQVIVRSY